MTERWTVLCFGGPLNERIVTTDRVPLLAPVRERISWAIDDADPIPRVQTVQYDLMRVRWHDWQGACLVAKGFPKHRITDALNAIAGMVAALHGAAR